MVFVNVVRDHKVALSYQSSDTITMVLSVHKHTAQAVTDERTSVEGELRLTRVDVV